MARLVGGSLAFVAVGVWMAGLVGPVPASHRTGPLMTQFLGWFGIVFFGMCALAGAFRWWKKAERLRIGSSGIRYIGWFDQTIPWNEIGDVSEWQLKNTKSIILHLRESSRSPAMRIAGQANRMLTGGEVPITLSGTDRTFEEAWAAIDRFRPRR